MPGATIIMGERMVVAGRITMPVPDVEPNNPSFNDINTSAASAITNTWTVSGLDTSISVTLSNTNSSIIEQFYLNAVASGTTITITNGDQVYCSYTKFGGAQSGTSTVVNDFSGNTIDTHTVALDQ